MITGQPPDRVDGALKASGRAAYVGDVHPERMAVALIVQSRIAVGRIVRIDREAAMVMPGVLAILAHDNAPRLPEGGRAGVSEDAGRENSLLQDDRVRYNAEPVALVVAESLEEARAAAGRLGIEYEASGALLDFEEAMRSAEEPDTAGRSPPDKDWGDVDPGFAGAHLRIERTYTTPMEHHNPLEPHGTVAEWDGDTLTLHDSTQYVSGVRETVAKTFGIDEGKVRVISPYVGGGFGTKGSVWSHVALAAMAAKVVRRPVKLVLDRTQMFGPVGGRPCTHQRLCLGAARDGRLTAVRHDVVSHTSRFEEFVEASAQPTRALYACPSGSTTERIARMDVATPTFMRAPGESTGTFALESAMDELAYALGIDPLELRLRNYAEADPTNGRPWSSKKLRECYAEAAARFGWPRRSSEPRSMREGRWLVGWGVATATYPAHLDSATASAARLADGSFLVRSGTHDMGTGTYTVMTQIAAEALGVPMERVRFELGDTSLPRAPTSGGSMTVASVGPAVVAACESLNTMLARRKHETGPTYEVLEAKGEAHPKSKDEEGQECACRSFGAIFVEVRVDEDLAIVRVPRIVASYSVGRIINRKTATSQIRGGIIMGIGQALLEESLLDQRYGRFANGNLAEYHVPVNADVGEIDVTFAQENDIAFNSLGARGLGEIGITGVAGAIANAVFHATGRRVRDLPITLEKILADRE